MNDLRAPRPVNRGGRPRLSPDAVGVTVSTVLPEAISVKLEAIADRKQVTMSALLRHIVILTLK